MPSGRGSGGIVSRVGFRLGNVWVDEDSDRSKTLWSVRLDSSWVHDGDVLVHIGLPKTSTTAIQAALAGARPRLASQSVLYPGSSPSQWTPAFDLTGLASPHYWGEPDPHDGRDSWSELVQDIRSSTHRRSVISAECLTWATSEQIDRLVRDLGSVRVLITVRALEQMLPSLWQEDLKRGLDLTLDQWWEEVFVKRSRVNNRLGNPETFDIPTIAGKWAERVGRDRVAIAIVPRAVDLTKDDSTNLGFLEEILGLMPGTLEATGLGDRNRGLTNVEAEILRRVNRSLDKSTLRYALYRDRLRRPVIEQLGRKRQPTATESRVTLPTPAVELCRQLGRLHVTALQEMGVMVLGEIADLVPTGPIPATPASPSAEAFAEAAAHMIHEFVSVDIPASRRNTPPPTLLLRWMPPACVPLARRIRDRVALRRHRRHRDR